MPSFSENFSGVILRLMGLNAGVQLFGHFLNSCPWFGQVNCMLGLPSSFCQSCAERRRWPTRGRHLVQAVMTATRLSPSKSSVSQSDTWRRKRRISRSLLCVFLSACSCAQRVTPACVLITFLTSSAFSSTYCVAVFPCIGAVYITKICQLNTEMCEVWSIFQQ